MTISKSIFVILLSFLTTQIISQTVAEAVRYSFLNYSGTARTAGVGYSFGAMGGDFGAVALNPAGLADFRKSEIMFSPSFNNINSTAYLNADAASTFDDKVSSRMFLDNIGIVVASSPGHKLITSNFAIGLNQLNNYTENISYSGTTEGSLTERFLQLGNGNSDEFGTRNPDFLDDFEAGLAYEVGALYEDPNNSLYYVTDFIESDQVSKNQRINRTGRMNELSFSWAAKFRNKIGLGISIGVPFVSFEELKSYVERDPNDDIPFFETLEYTENLTTSGTGINVKLGLNTTVAKIVRLGLAYHSPSYIGLNDSYSTALRYTYNDGTNNSFNSESPDGLFEYSVTTPGKFLASAGALLNISQDLKGFVNADFEYKDYGTSSFNLGDDSNEIEFERELNDNISSDLQATTAFKLGAEIAYKMLRIRAGANLIGSPYVDESRNNVSNLYSFGLGLRKDRFYIDIAYLKDNSTTEYAPYRVIEDNRIQRVTNESSRNKVLFTFGFKL